MGKTTETPAAEVNAAIAAANAAAPASPTTVTPEATPSAPAAATVVEEVVAAAPKVDTRKIKCTETAEANIGDLGRVVIYKGEEHTLRDDAASLFVTLGVAQYM